MRKACYLIAGIFIAITFAQCGSDDDGNAKDPCSQTAWTGNYTGSCEDQPYSLTVTSAGSQQLEIEVTVPNGSQTSLGTIDGCNYSFTLGGIEISATLQGNTITYNDSTLSCTSIVFTRN